MKLLHIVIAVMAAAIALLWAKCFGSIAVQAKADKIAKPINGAIAEVYEENKSSWTKEGLKKAFGWGAKKV